MIAALTLALVSAYGMLAGAIWAGPKPAGGGLLAGMWVVAVLLAGADLAEGDWVMSAVWALASLMWAQRLAESYEVALYRVQE